MCVVWRNTVFGILVLPTLTLVCSNNFSALLIKILVRNTLYIDANFRRFPYNLENRNNNAFFYNYFRCSD